MRFRVVVLLLFVFSFISISSVSSDTILQDFVERINNLTSSNELETARRKKKGGGGKYTTLLLFGALLIKSIIFPLVFKAMAVMAGVSVLLSTMGLIISSIVAYAKLVPKVTPVKVVRKHPHWAKDDSVKNDYENYVLMTPPPQ